MAKTFDKDDINEIYKILKERMVVEEEMPEPKQGIEETDNRQPTAEKTLEQEFHSVVPEKEKPGQNGPAVGHTNDEDADDEEDMALPDLPGHSPDVRPLDGFSWDDVEKKHNVTDEQSAAGLPAENVQTPAEDEEPDAEEQSSGNASDNPLDIPAGENSESLMKTVINNSGSPFHVTRVTVGEDENPVVRQPFANEESLDDIERKVEEEADMLVDAFAGGVNAVNTPKETVLSTSSESMGGKEFLPNKENVEEPEAVLSMENINKEESVGVVAVEDTRVDESSDIGRDKRFGFNHKFYGEDTFQSRYVNETVGRDRNSFESAENKSVATDKAEEPDMQEKEHPADKSHTLKGECVMEKMNCAWKVTMRDEYVDVEFGEMKLSLMRGGKNVVKLGGYVFTMEGDSFSLVQE